MIHAASLFHDDVIDEADTRRGVPSLNKMFGNKLAILAGEKSFRTLRRHIFNMKRKLCSKAHQVIIEPFMHVLPRTRRSAMEWFGGPRHPRGARILAPS